MCKSLIDQLNIKAIDTSKYINNPDEFIKAVTEMSNIVNNIYSCQYDYINMLKLKKY